jgi:DHA3 family tetracycline resistance protein-like MFS transporter
VRRLPATTLYYAAEAWLSFAFAITFTVSAVYFVDDVGMNPLELVLVGTFMELAVFVFEIPTGVVADTFSRRLSIVVGWTIMGLGLVLAGLVAEIWAVWAGWAIWGLGYTFTSGAEQAWITDEVGVERVGRVFARAHQFGYAGGLVGIGASVAIASVDLGLAVAAGGALASAFGVFAAFAMPETGFRRRPAAERENSLRELKRTAVHGGRFVRAQPVLLLIIAIFFFAGASTESFDRLWQAQVLRNIGLPGLGALDPVVWFGIVGVGSSLLGLLASQVLVRRFERSGQEGLARILFAVHAVQLGAVFAFALAGDFVLALSAVWVYYLTRSIASPVEQTWINEQITDSSVRATVISMTGQSDAIGQVAGGPGLGGIATVFGLRAGLLSGGVLLAPALWLYGRAIRHHGAEPELQVLPESTPEPGV